MSLRVNFNAIMGEVILKQTSRLDGTVRKYKINICAANAVCAFIYEYKDERGETMCHLMNFLDSPQHITNLLRKKQELFEGDVTKVKLNLAYDNCKQILRYFTRMGNKVECYYKEGKK